MLALTLTKPPIEVVYKLERMGVIPFWATD